MAACERAYGATERRTDDVAMTHRASRDNSVPNANRTIFGARFTGRGGPSGVKMQERVHKKLKANSLLAAPRNRNKRQWPRRAASKWNGQAAPVCSARLTTRFIRLSASTPPSWSGRGLV